MKNHLKYGNPPEKENIQESAASFCDSESILTILFDTCQIQCSFALKSVNASQKTKQPRAADRCIFKSQYGCCLFV